MSKFSRYGNVQPRDLEDAIRALIPASAKNVVVGPVCWQPSDGHEAKVYYFMVASGVQDATSFKLDQFSANKSDINEMREHVKTILLQPGRVIVDTDDEMVLARWLTILWPNAPKAQRLYANLKAERGL